jgi:cytochrome c
MFWHLRLIGFVTSLTVAAGFAAFADTVGDPTRGEPLYKKRCLPCHQIGPDAINKIGPELNGVVGGRAGSIAGYSYSEAIKNSGLIWNEVNLTQFLRSARAMLPGTSMTAAPIQKDADIADLIAYLKTFQPQKLDTASSVEQSISFPALADTVAGHEGVTYGDLARMVVPDLVERDRVLSGAAPIKIRDLKGGAVVVSPSDKINGCRPWKTGGSRTKTASAPSRGVSFMASK